MGSDDAESEVTLGWRIDRAQREALLGRFPPLYPKVVADHVTLRPNADPADPTPDEREGLIVGRVDDGRGVQALIVSIGGHTDRPGGGTYHITWSLGDGRRAVESNAVIAELGWAPLGEPIAISLEPARFNG